MQPASDGGELGRQACVVPDSAVLAQSDFDTCDEAMLLLELLPDKPYLLVPSTAAPAVEGAFELRLLSSVVLELVPLPETKVISLAGAWTSTSGGCDLNAFWFKRNPRYVLVPQEPLTVTITLTRHGSWKRGTSLDRMIGFYVVAAEDTAGNVTQPSKAVKTETSFVPLAHVSLTYELRMSDTTPAFVIVPCTYGQGCAGQFQLSVSASAAFTLSTVDDSSQAALAMQAG